jgi:hypothetical protein
MLKRNGMKAASSMPFTLFHNLPEQYNKKESKSLYN